MPNIRQPRSGSLQFWPRKRSKKAYSRIRSSPKIKEPGVVGFAGYKVGMTQVLAIETNKHSNKKGEQISIPVTVLECPPMKIAGANFYKKFNGALKLEKQFLFASKDQNLDRKINLTKKEVKIGNINPEDYEDIRALVYTQPSLTNMGKKKPEIFELNLGGSFEEKLDFVKTNKEFTVESVFNEGELVDLKSITKGKGFQGAVKRFGISIRSAKSEKSIRTPGSLGPWTSQGHILWRVAHAGKMGYHQRTEYNKQIIKITDQKEVTPKGGFLKYGVPKNTCILIKGSIAGSRKRLVIMQKPIRNVSQKSLPTVEKINLEAKQGN